MASIADRAELASVADSAERNKHWFALQVRSRNEHAIVLMLQNKGYETFLPTYRSRRVWSDRVTELVLPLFAGYVFTWCSLSDRLAPIVTTPGVVRIVGVGNRPAPIADDEIVALKKVVASGLTAGPCRYFPKGSGVVIAAGPLTGVQGTIVDIKNRRRVVISVSLLQRSVAVEVDHAWLVEASARPRIAGLQVDGRTHTISPILP